VLSVKLLPSFVIQTVGLHVRALVRTMPIHHSSDMENITVYLSETYTGVYSVSVIEKHCYYYRKWQMFLTLELSSNIELFGLALW
jgi:hypothetical protein